MFLRSSAVNMCMQALPAVSRLSLGLAATRTLTHMQTLKPVLFSTDATKPTSKDRTNIPGLPAVENAREVLSALYKRTLEELTAFSPDWHYRPHTESFTKYRLSVVEENENIFDIENTIQCGQIEELIEQAEDELKLISVMKEEGWEKLIEPTMAPVCMEVDERNQEGARPDIMRLASNLPPTVEGVDDDAIEKALQDPEAAKEILMKMEKVVEEHGIKL